RHTQHRALAAAGIADDVRQAFRTRHMLERAALLARENKPATAGAVQRALAIVLRDRMPAARVEGDGGIFKPRFGLDHRAAGEPLLAASIFAEPDQLG